MNQCISFIVKAASVAALGLSAVSAHATDFSFRQSGFVGDAVIIGTFSGDDLDGNGQISSFSNEITSFSLSFSGNALVGSFNHNLGNLFGLVYDLDNGTLGDGIRLEREGLASNWKVGTGIEYASGIGPLNIFAGRVLDTSTRNFSETSQLISVAVVPEPSVLLMLLTGVGLVLTRRRGDA